MMERTGAQRKRDSAQHQARFVQPLLMLRAVALALRARLRDAAVASRNGPGRWMRQVY